MRPLLAKAAEYGVRVHFWNLPDRTRGLYDHDEKRIYLNSRLTPFERVSTLAHELGHAHYGHDCSSPSNERQARAYAARTLIDPGRYATLKKVNPDQYWVAEEMSVTAQVVFDFEELQLRGETGRLPACNG